MVLFNLEITMQMEDSAFLLLSLKLSANNKRLDCVCPEIIIILAIQLLHHSRSARMY